MRGPLREGAWPAQGRAAFRQGAPLSPALRKGQPGSQVQRPAQEQGRGLELGVSRAERMRRRTFLIAVGGSALWGVPKHGIAQSLPVLGFLNSASPSTYAFNATAFREGLREAGYVEGQNVNIEYRWANNDYGRRPALAREVVERRAAVIAATGALAPARRARSAST